MKKKIFKAILSLKIAIGVSNINILGIKSLGVFSQFTVIAVERTITIQKNLLSQFIYGKYLKNGHLEKIYFTSVNSHSIICFFY